MVFWSCLGCTITIPDDVNAECYVYSTKQSFSLVLNDKENYIGVNLSLCINVTFAFSSQKEYYTGLVYSTCA